MKGFGNVQVWIVSSGSSWSSNYIRGITQLRWNFQFIKVLFFVIMPDSVGGSFMVAYGAWKALFYLSCHQAGISVSGINHTWSCRHNSSVMKYWNIPNIDCIILKISLTVDPFHFGIVNIKVLVNKFVTYLEENWEKF